MDLCRLKLVAARALGLHFKLICLACGHTAVVTAVSLSRHADPLTPIGALPFRCRECRRKEIEVFALDVPEREAAPEPNQFVFRVDRWTPEGRLRALVAGSSDLLVAHGAYEAAVASHPGEHWTLRQTTRMIRAHEPPEGE